MVPLFFGFDPREEVGAHTFCSSVIHHASRPVGLIPLHLPLFQGFYREGQRDGTNAFTFTRFLIPYLQEFKGWAIFADGADMIVMDDIAELWALRNPYCAVQVVKHDYKTRHPRKYVGTSMEASNEDYPCKNWSSVMLINCSHFGWRQMTPERVAKMKGSELHRFEFLEPEWVGDLPPEWNWLADEHGDNPRAKLLHFTAGLPAWEHYRNTPHARDWFAANRRISHAA